MVFHIWFVFFFFFCVLLIVFLLLLLLLLFTYKRYLNIVTGYKSLSWTTRVRIALDAAKGLEYIHMHTKPYYVHRDVKTSNILLDSSFRAKVCILHPLWCRPWFKVFNIVSLSPACLYSYVVRFVYILSFKHHKHLKYRTKHPYGIKFDQHMLLGWTNFFILVFRLFLRISFQYWLTGPQTTLSWIMSWLVFRQEPIPHLEGAACCNHKVAGLSQVANKTICWVVLHSITCNNDKRPLEMVVLYFSL